MLLVSVLLRPRQLSALPVLFVIVVHKNIYNQRYYRISLVNWPP